MREHFYFFRSEHTLCTRSCTVGKKVVPFSMAIGNEEVTHECFTEHTRMGTASMKDDKETQEDGKKRGVSMENKAGTKERRIPDGLNYPNQNTIIINIICLYFL